jgi:hypothetical protein
LKGAGNGKGSFYVRRMSQHDAQRYEHFAGQVRKQVQALRLVIGGLQAKAKDRQWLKNQTTGERDRRRPRTVSLTLTPTRSFKLGELDDTRLIEGITGEKSIYKKRGEQDPEPGKRGAPCRATDRPFKVVAIFRSPPGKAEAPPPRGRPVGIHVSI